MVKETYTSSNKHGSYFYYSRAEKGKNYCVHYRKKEGSEKEEIVLDENELAKGHDFFALGIYDVSYELNHDHPLLVYSSDVTGEERYTLRIKDLKTGSLLADQLDNICGKVIWHKKCSGFFYLKVDDKWRTNRVFFHKLGDSQERDLLIYQEKDETFSLSLFYTADESYVLITSKSKDARERYFISLEDETLTPHIVIPRRAGHIYTIDYAAGYFYLWTNDQGPNFRLLRTPKSDFSKNKWEEIIPHNPTSYLFDFALYQNHLVVKQVEDGMDKIRVHDFNDMAHPKEITFPKSEASYVADISFTTYKEPFVEITYSSLATPLIFLKYDFKTQQTTIQKVNPVLGGFDSQNYQVERLKAPSKDGTLVPISLIYKKSLKKEEGNPLVLCGYGAYGNGFSASFNKSILTLLDRGFIYAIAHVRGGDELGFGWYEDGKLLNKMHTFEDIIGCSEYLIEKGYTNPKNIALEGVSAGGVLMGYCANERPDLYRAITAWVPFVDALNTLLDSSINLTAREYKEWGNPSKSKEYYDLIKSYAPYENVKAQDYPHIYVTAGLNDQRVPYWEPTKWVAKLRHFKTDSNILLLDVNMAAGHSGSSGDDFYLREVAKYYAFLLTVFNKQE